MLHAISFAEVYEAVDYYNREGLNPHGPNAPEGEWPLEAVFEFCHPQLDRLALPYGLPPSTPDGRDVVGFTTSFNFVHVTTRARAGRGYPRIYRFACHSRQVTDARVIVSRPQDPEYYAAGHSTGQEWLDAFRKLHRPLVPDDGFLTEMPPPESLPLEPPLSVELVPEPCWWSNLRSNLPRQDWETLRRIVITAAGGDCEVCGVRPRRSPHAHERWIYDEERHVQTLAHLVCLCQDCHESIHVGYANKNGRFEEATAHLMEINGWSKTELNAHLNEHYDAWERRNKISWKLDIDYIKLLGVRVPKFTDRPLATPHRPPHSEQGLTGNP
jgi:hypothetical protein